MDLCRKAARVGEYLGHLVYFGCVGFGAHEFVPQVAVGLLLIALANLALYRRA